MYDFKALKKSIEDTKNHYKEELSAIRTGRAAPALLDTIKVESYGSKLPLNQVGTVSVEDARTLRIAPWEIDAINQIEQAIREADLGVTLSSDEKGVRVCFPELTSERRAQLIKLTNSKLEETRITLRRHREDVWSEIQKLQKEGELSEDEKFTSKDEMEKIIKEGNESLEEMAKKKEQELNA